MTGTIQVRLVDKGAQGQQQQQQNAQLPLGHGSLHELQQAVRCAFAPCLDGKRFLLTTTSRDISTDADLDELSEGQLLLVVTLNSGVGNGGGGVGEGGAAGGGGAGTGDALGPLLSAPVRERINFSPHPKTMTMAGDYEYFAAQGHHPFPYALAELIDNALRALLGPAPPPPSSSAHSPPAATAAGNGGAGAGNAACSGGVSGHISITFALQPLPGRAGGLQGAVVVQDNGRGMGRQELNEWAVMNLSMQDRQQQWPAAAGGAGGRSAAQHQHSAGRFLNGELSYFGVGSKAAAFFMGQVVKVATRTADSRFVHEISIAAGELEQRYRDGQPVYEGDLIHRDPGDDSTLLPFEQPFEVLRGLVAAESATTSLPSAEAEAAGPAEAAAGSGGGEAGDSHDDAMQVVLSSDQEAGAAMAAAGGGGAGGGSGGGGSGGRGGCSSGGGSFTRVVIGQLKPSILEQITDEEKGRQVCRDLAHLYHYYLHGEQGCTELSPDPGSGEGVTASSAEERPPDGVERAAACGGGRDGGGGGGGPLPDIELRVVMLGRELWRCNLADVRDDMETKYLRAQRAQLDFVLQIPGKSDVLGRVYYFPFENEAETLPIDTQPMGRQPLVTYNMATQQQPQGTAAAVAGGLTQALQQTQQRHAGGDGGATQALGDVPEEEDENAAAWLRPQLPLFEAFWQGRLIPGARIESLPFIEAVRAKRQGNAARDKLPDEVFRRLRGSLFFDSSYLVTRNKLTFRDNLQELLATAVPVERNFEKRFRDWLARCHAELDRVITYKHLAAPGVQADTRQAAGDEALTVFGAMSDGSRSVAEGDVVRLASKPALVGRVMHFVVPQVARGDGPYPGGRVAVQLLPSEVWGQGTRLYSVRRIESTLGESAAEEHASRELAKLPAAMSVQPLRLAKAGQGGVMTLQAGECLPDSGVMVVNGGKQRVTRAVVGGSRHALAVRQQLLYLGGGGGTSGDAGGGSGGDGGGGGSGELQGEEQDGAPAAAAAAKPAGRAGGKAAAAAKRRKAGRKRKQAPEEQEEEGGGGQAIAKGASGDSIDAGGEVIVSIDNRSPAKDVYCFPRTPKLTRTGTYLLTYILLPELPTAAGSSGGGGGGLRLSTHITVQPGPAVAFELQGEGRAAAASRALLLGEVLPPLSLQLRDPYGNPAALPDGNSDVLADGATLSPVAAAAAAAGPEEATTAIVGAAADGTEGDGSSRRLLPGGLVSLTLHRRAEAGDSEDGDGGAGEGGEVGEQVLGVHVSGTARLQGNIVVLDDLSIDGPPTPSPSRQGKSPGSSQAAAAAEQCPGLGGMQLFVPAVVPQTPPSPQAVQGNGGEEGSSQTPILAASTVLRVEWRGLGAQQLPLLLRPGPPASLRLLGNHPWQHQQQGEMGADDAAAAAGPSSFPQRQLVQLVQGSLPCLDLEPGQALPRFEVQALDRWGNPTAPSASLRFAVSARCPCLDPQECPAIEVSPSGVATILGLTASATPSSAASSSLQRLAAAAAAAGGGSVGEGGSDGAAVLALDVVYGQPPHALLQAAVDRAAAVEAKAQGEGSLLRLPLRLTQSPAPARLVLLRDGVELPTKTMTLDDGALVDVHTLEGCVVGSLLQGLSLMALDGAGRPLERPVTGRLRLSWLNKARKTRLGNEPVELPGIELPDQTGEPASRWVNFQGVKQDSGISLEAMLQVGLVPDSPYTWAVSLLQYDTSQGGGGDDAGVVRCGQPFTLEVEAQDRFNNRCSGGLNGSVPIPVVVPLSNGKLEYDPQAWEKGWVASQGSEEVYIVKLALWGEPGDVRLVVRDPRTPDATADAADDVSSQKGLSPQQKSSSPAAAGKRKRGGGRGAAAAATDGAEAMVVEGREEEGGGGGEEEDGKAGAFLVEDQLMVSLAPGPARKLRLEGPCELRAGTRGVLPPLVVRAVDEYGNPVERMQTFEVLLQPQALAADGSGAAASISVKGGNKAKVSQSRGHAAFAETRVVAERAGEYQLRVVCASRKVALEDASLALHLSPINRVTELTVDEGDLPEGLAVGQPFRVRVAVETEDGRRLQREAAAGGLQLRLLPEGASRAQGLLFSPVLQPAGEGEEGEEEEEVAARQEDSSNVFDFEVEGLQGSGRYTLTAEYAEPRAELKAVLAQKDWCWRSVSVAVDVSPGPPVAATLECDLASQPIVAGNGQDAAQRTLLRGAAFQLRDCLGNPVALPGVPLRLGLQLLVQCGDSDNDGAGAGGGGGGGGGDGEVPELEAERLAAETDSRGRAFFGDVLVRQGTGRAPSPGMGAAATATLRCCLRLEAEGLATNDGSGDGSGAAPPTAAAAGAGWGPAWECEVLFSDDGANAEVLRGLQERHAVAAARRQDLQAEVDAAREAAEAAAARHHAAQRAAQQAAAPLQHNGTAANADADKGLAPAQPPPSTVAEAEARLASAQRVIDEATGGEAGGQQQTVEAQYGARGQALTNAVARCLSLGDPGVVGVFAHLGTIDDQQLNRILSAQYRGMLQVVVVRDSECRTRLIAALRAASLPTPDILSLTHAQPYRGPVSGTAPGADRCSPAAARLTRDACGGTDPPLPWPLPHSRALRTNGGGGGDGAMSANSWPDGCLGYAFNLVRPREAQQRASLLYGLLGNTLVFETLEQGQRYREYMTQVLHSGTPDIVTLDLSRISSKGITSGSSFRVPQLQDTPLRFGSTPPVQSAELCAAAQESAALSALLPLLHEAEAAEGDAAQAEEAAQQAERDASGGVADLDAELRDLEEQLERLTGHRRPSAASASQPGPSKATGGAAGGGRSAARGAGRAGRAAGGGGGARQKGRRRARQEEEEEEGGQQAEGGGGGGEQGEEMQAEGGQGDGNAAAAARQGHGGGRRKRLAAMQE